MKNRNLNKIYRDKKKYPSDGMPYKSKKKTYTGKNIKKKSKNTSPEGIKRQRFETN